MKIIVSFFILSFSILLRAQNPGVEVGVKTPNQVAVMKDSFSTKTPRLFKVYLDCYKPNLRLAWNRMPNPATANVYIDLKLDSTNDIHTIRINIPSWPFFNRADLMAQGAVTTEAVWGRLLGSFGDDWENQWKDHAGTQSYRTPINEPIVACDYSKTNDQLRPLKCFKPQIDYIENKTTGSKTPPSAWAVRGEGRGNYLYLDLPVNGTITFDSKGQSVAPTVADQLIHGVRIFQTPDPTFAGGQVPMEGSVDSFVYLNEQANTLAPGASLHISVPGSDWGGTCGGYISPLMLFFDQSLPQFSKVIEFEMIEGRKSSMFWVEKNAPGYFLARLDQGRTEITNGSQLFGNDPNKNQANGFVALRKFDLNRDGVIDKADAIFSKLVLWQDRNSDGKSQPDELASLGKFGIQSIHLKYTKSIEPIGDRAEIRQASFFSYIKNGKTRQGQILDIWLKDANPVNQLSRNEK